MYSKVDELRLPMGRPNVTLTESKNDNLYDNLYDTKTYNELIMQYRNGPCYTYTKEEIKKYRNKLLVKKLIEMKKKVLTVGSSFDIL